MGDIITLSSDDEIECLPSPPKKKVKICTVGPLEIKFDGEKKEHLIDINDLETAAILSPELSNELKNDLTAVDICGVKKNKTPDANHETEIEVNELVTFEEKVQENVISSVLSEESKHTIVIESHLTVTETEKTGTDTNDKAIEIIDDDGEEELLKRRKTPLSDAENDGITDSASDISAVITPGNGIDEQKDVENHENESNLSQENRQIDINEIPSTSKTSDTQLLLEQFLDICTESIKDSKYQEQLPTKYSRMWRYFNRCEGFHNDPELKKYIQESVHKAKQTAPEAVMTFSNLFFYLQDLATSETNYVEMSEEHLRKVRKLEKTVKLLIKKIKSLEESEINFDDDADSTYIQLDRYTQRLNKVYAKYCQILEKNPNSGRLTYDKILFTSSNFNEINRAITKSYKHNKFPTYYDIEKCVKKCVEKHNLPLGDFEVKEESKKCFVSLGNLLQTRRRKELYEVHCGFIAMGEDPAKQDQQLKKKLDENQSIGDKKMKEIVEQYVQLQEKNVTVELSEDSEDSNYKSSESGDEV